MFVSSYHMRSLEIVCEYIKFLWKYRDRADNIF